MGRRREDSELPLFRERLFGSSSDSTSIPARVLRPSTTSNCTSIGDGTNVIQDDRVSPRCAEGELRGAVGSPALATHGTSRFPSLAVPPSLLPPPDAKPLWFDVAPSSSDSNSLNAAEIVTSTIDGATADGGGGTSRADHGEPFGGAARVKEMGRTTHLLCRELEHLFRRGFHRRRGRREDRATAKGGGRERERVAGHFYE